MDNRTFQELTKIHEEHQAEKLESTNRRIKSYLAAHARLESVENAKAFDRRAHLATKQLGPYAGKLDRNGRATWPLGARVTPTTRRPRKGSKTHEPVTIFTPSIRFTVSCRF
ncbi:hypothetical protein PSTT_04072 [Puccinia striiformis]|uniref:Uncharacterized protein n=1 Tax=Puccinia striiformis TaxID=27350 RepID=A0A2S4VUE6_9BASI|nr:hypothetical protein PSTT_04072 [Puccinia striiformis]